MAERDIRKQKVLLFRSGDNLKSPPIYGYQHSGAFTLDRKKFLLIDQTVYPYAGWTVQDYGTGRFFMQQGKSGVIMKQMTEREFTNILEARRKPVAYCIYQGRNDSVGIYNITINLPGRQERIEHPIEHDWSFGYGLLAQAIRKYSSQFQEFDTLGTLGVIVS